MSRLVLALVATAIASLASVQEPATPLARYLITIETTATDVTLTCNRGCDWKTLRFPLTATPTWLDQTRLLGEQGDKVPGDGPFLLAVYATKGAADDGLDLLCKWGCRYQSWAFSPRNVAWVIDSCEPVPLKLWKPEHAEVPCAERGRER